MPLNNNKQFVHHDLIEPEKVDMALYYKFIFTHLRNANQYYPNFQAWFFGKVVPEIESGKRQLLIEHRSNQAAGIAIVKLNCEKKLCTLRISDQFQNRGVGIRLFERCFDVLETDKPFLTVSEEKLPEFQRIFDYYGFEVSSIRKDLYRKGKNEHFFNEY